MASPETPKQGTPQAPQSRPRNPQSAAAASSGKIVLELPDNNVRLTIESLEQPEPEMESPGPTWEEAGEKPYDQAKKPGK